LNFKKKSGRGKNFLKNIKVAVALSAALILWATLPAWSQTPPSAPPSRALPRTDSQKAKTGPLSLSEVRELAVALGGGILNQKEVLDKLERGVDFEASVENLETLRSAGATRPIIDQIKKIAPQPRQPVGTLTLRCEPAECVIKLNGQPIGDTQDGQLVKTNVPFGEITVDFEREGYVAQQKTVQVNAEVIPPIGVALKPTAFTKGENGKKLLALMLHALGVQAGLKALSNLTGTGAITSFAEGKQSDWDFDLATGPPALIEMKVTGTAGVLAFECNGERCAEKKKGRPRGKPLVGPLSDKLQTNLRAFSRYNLAAVLEAIGSQSVRFTSLTADSNSKKDQRLRAEAQDSIYEIVIGNDLLPSLVEYESKGGLGSGLKVSYADYIKVNDFRYPKRTTIRLPDVTQQGIEIRLDQVKPRTGR
jgi:hypothetical protein